jgi:hypothetical protein
MIADYFGKQKHLTTAFGDEPSCKIYGGIFSTINRAPSTTSKGKIRRCNERQKFHKQNTLRQQS